MFLLSQENEAAIESKVSKYLLLLDPSCLFLGTVINLAVSLTAYKQDIYEYFSRASQEHHGPLNQFIKDTVEEISFLRWERNFHQNDLADRCLKVC